MVRYLWRVLAVGVSLVLSVGLINAMAGPNGTGGGPTAEKIVGTGSDTTEVLMLHINGLYTVSEGCLRFNGATKPLDFSCVKPDDSSVLHTENYEHDQVYSAPFVGSGTGINQVCKQGQANVAYVDYARSSRAPSGSDCKGLHFVAYARDGIGVESHDDGTINSGIHGMVNPDLVNCPNPGWCISFAQLKAIYGNPNCNNSGAWASSNWTNIGGQNQTMWIYTPQSGSGTRSAFEGFLGVTDSTVCISFWGQSLIQQTNTKPENQNTGIVTAELNTFIFPFSFAIFSTEISDPTFKLALLDNIAVNATTIADGTYEMGRFVYNVFCSTSAASTCGAAPGHIVTQKTADFIGEEGWICKPSAATVPGWGTRTDLGVPTVDADPNNNNMYAPHRASPHYQTNWETLIQNKITQVGFGGLAPGPISLVDTNTDHCRLTTT